VTPLERLQAISERKAGLPGTPYPIALGADEVATLDRDVSSRDLIDQARFEDIARRLLMQQPPRAIAKAHNLSERQLRRVLRLPAMIDVFEKAKESVFTNLDDLIKDEKASPLLRARAQTIRAQTLLGEIMGEVKHRIQGGGARSSDLKVGMETAFGVIDRSKTELGTATVGGGTSIELNLSLQQGTAQVFGDAVRESGIDLSDVIDAVSTSKPDESPEKE
jgi:hypothetical protein